MKLTVDEIISLARTFDVNGEMPEILEEFINLIVNENANKEKLISDNEEFGEDFLIAAMNVLNKKELVEV